MERSISGPDQDFLTEAEAAAWLRIDPEDFREYVRMGLLPKGIPYGKRPITHRWHWMDLVAVGHFVRSGFIKLPGSDEDGPPPKVSRNG